MSIITPFVTSAVLSPSPDVTVSSTRSGSSTQDEKPVKKQMADYELPPRNYGLSNHYYHYGWPVTDAMLKAILIKLNLPVPSPDIVPGTLGHRLMRWLRFPGGISYVYCNPDEWCEKQDKVLVYKEEGKEAMRHVTFFSIGCTYSKRYYWRRPTQEAFETLIDLFGEKPRWLEDFYTKQQFMLDTIDWW